MSAFTTAELEYLKSQPLMRFATASPSGRPDVAPVVFEVDGSVAIEDAGGRPRFRITPEVIVSWGINDMTPGIPKMERREVR